MIENLAKVPIWNFSFYWQNCVDFIQRALGFPLLVLRVFDFCVLVLLFACVLALQIFLVLFSFFNWALLLPLIFNFQIFVILERASVFSVPF